MAKSSKQAKQDKVHKTMSEFKAGTLHSGSAKGPVVTTRRQAEAIALNQARKGK
jgi:hypothetical protein